MNPQQAANRHTADSHGPSRADAPRRGGGAGMLAFALAALLARGPFMSRPGFHIDELQFFTWMTQSIHEGVGRPYEPHPAGGGRRWSNYPPVYLLVLNATGRMFTGVTGHALDAALWSDFVESRETDAVRAVRVWLRAPGVLADALTAALLWRWLTRRVRPRFAAAVCALFALHPALIFDSAVWGQVDSVQALLLLLSARAAEKRQTARMSFWAVLAVLTKAQALLFAPLWLACLMRRDAVGRLPAAAVAGLIAATAVLTPYLAAGALGGVWDSLFGAVGRYPFVHLNGFSAWFIFNPLERSMLGEPGRPYAWDQAPVLTGVTPRAIGLSALAVISAIVVWIVVRERGRPRAVRWAACVLPLAFFCLPTQIHERYLVPAIALWAFAASPRAGWWTGWIGVGLTAFVNMAWVWPAAPGGWMHDLLAGRLIGLWAGRPLGVWCAALLLLMLAAILLEPHLHWRRTAARRSDGRIPSGYHDRS